MAAIESSPLAERIAERRAQLSTMRDSEATMSYVKRGDYLSVNFSDEDYFAVNIDEILTIYRSVESDALVGCKIKGVTLLAEKVTNMITITDDDMDVSLLLLSALGTRHDVEHIYYDVSQQAQSRHLKFPISELRRAA